MKTIRQTDSFHERVEKLMKFLDANNLEITYDGNAFRVTDTSKEDIPICQGCYIVDADSYESVQSLPHPFEFKLKIYD